MSTPSKQTSHSGLIPLREPPSNIFFRNLYIETSIKVTNLVITRDEKIYDIEITMKYPNNHSETILLVVSSAQSHNTVDNRIVNIWQRLNYILNYILMFPDVSEIDSTALKIKVLKPVLLYLFTLFFLMCLLISFS